MVTPLKMSHSHTATLSAYDPEAGHHWPMPPLEILDTHAHDWVSFLCMSLLFSPGSWCAQVCCCCALQESISAVLCKFCWFYDGVNGNLLKRAYAIPRAHVAGYCWPVPPQEALRHSSGSVSVCWACVFELPMSEQLRRPGAWPVHCPRWALHLKHLPGPSHSVSLCVLRAPSQVCHEAKLSGFLWRADLRLWPSWLKSSIQDLRKM